MSSRRRPAHRVESVPPAPLFENKKTRLKGQVIISLGDGKAGYLDADLFLHGFA